MGQSKHEGIERANETVSKRWGLPASVNALVLLLIVASVAVIVTACGDDPAPVPTPEPAVVTAPTTSDPAPTPEPTATVPPAPTAVPTATPAPAPTAVPTATPAPAPTAVPTATPAPAPTAVPTPTAAPSPAPTSVPAPTPEPVALDDDALTQAFVAAAIEYYGQNGLDATVEFYRSEASVENGRSLLLLDETETTLLVYRSVPTLQGQYVGPGSSFSAFGRLIQAATDEGFWITTRGINPVTRQEEPRRVLVVSHDNLVFSASHSVLVEDVAESVKEYVDNAIAKYDSDGLDATIAHYNSQDSLSGQFYLFLIGADDIYVAHPIFPHLIGTDIKDVVGSDGQELGKEIALATEDGVWVEYLWPHPVSRIEQQKVTWAIRHDGLIFASGYYAGEPETGPAGLAGRRPQGLHHPVREPGHRAL